MPTKNKRRAAFRKRLTSDPPPPDAETRAKLDSMPPGFDPGRELLQWATREGLMTEADAARVDAWAEDLAKALSRGDLTEDEAHRMITERTRADASRRGKA